MKKNQSLNRKPECNGSPGKALGFKNVISAFDTEIKVLIKIILIQQIFLEIRQMVLTLK